MRRNAKPARPAQKTGLWTYPRQVIFGFASGASGIPGPPLDRHRSPPRRCKTLAPHRPYAGPRLAIRIGAGLGIVIAAAFEIIVEIGVERAVLMDGWIQRQADHGEPFFYIVQSLF